MSSEWGRIDDDGTVYLRTADGERVIGSWHAGTPEDGIEFYVRRYADLEADVALLEGASEVRRQRPRSGRRRRPQAPARSSRRPPRWVTSTR